MENLTQAKTCQKAAIEYTSKGYTVVRYNHNSKKCYVRNWGDPDKPGAEKCTNDPATVRNWNLTHKMDNLGIVTRGILVVDIDVWNWKNGTPKSGKADLERLEAILGELPKNVRARSASGGFHYFFRKPEGIEFRQLAPIHLPNGDETNVDLRAGQNGTITAAPSRYSPAADEIGPGGGGFGTVYHYSWETELPRIEDLPDLPQKWIDFLKKPALEPRTTTPTFDLDAIDPDDRSRRCIAYLNKIGYTTAGSGNGEANLWTAAQAIFCYFSYSDDYQKGMELFRYYNEQQAGGHWGDRELESKARRACEQQAGRGKCLEKSPSFSALSVPFIPNGSRSEYREIWKDKTNSERGENTQPAQPAEELTEEQKAEEKRQRLAAAAEKPNVDYLDDIADYWKSGGPERVPTGFDELDSAIGGGLPPGLVYIGALPSIGKTSFSLQIADNIARSRKTDEKGELVPRRVLFFSLETPRSDLIARSLSRLTGKNADEIYLKSDRENALKEMEEDRSLSRPRPTEEDNLDHFFGIISTPQQIQTGDGFTEKTKWGRNFRDAYTAYKNEIAPNIVIIDQATKRKNSGDNIESLSITTADIRQEIDRQTAAGTPPDVIVIDYLQILEPAGTDGKFLPERQRIDLTIDHLTKLRDAYNIPIIIISTLSRAGYGKEISNESFKESGKIEYSADILLGLQYDGTGTTDENQERKERQWKSAAPERELELKVLKHRNGQSGTCLAIRFYPRSMYFVELNRVIGEHQNELEKSLEYEAAGQAKIRAAGEKKARLKSIERSLERYLSASRGDYDLSEYEINLLSLPQFNGIGADELADAAEISKMLERLATDRGIIYRIKDKARSKNLAEF